MDVAEREAQRCERQSAGLPIGVQVVARHWREDVVLRVMRILEDHFRKSPEYPRFAD
jgi:fatty acid amide hydrolase